MLLLVLVVGAYVAFREVNRTTPDSPVEPVDWRPAADFAREQADFPVVAPRELPEGWIATSVRYERGDEQAWHLGVLTDEERYIGLEQSQDSVATMVERFVDEEAEADGSTSVDGRSWEVWRDDRDTALVREADGVTTLVVGTVGRERLEDYVELLE